VADGPHAAPDAMRTVRHGPTDGVAFASELARRGCSVLVHHAVLCGSRRCARCVRADSRAAFGSGTSVLVVVTGGTGYLGSHAIAALAGAGHRIRGRARSPELGNTAIAPHGVETVETVSGDVTDPGAVERALEGADAVVHAASVFSLDARRADEMRSVNVRGTDIVLGSAHRLGLDPIAYVSSELALLPPAEGEVLTPDSRVGQPSWPYCRSKADSELIARRYQHDGAPVVSVLPAALWGPHDPHFGEGVTRTTNILKGRYPIVMRGGMHVADVRDVAAVLAAVMSPGAGPRSYMVAGHYISLPDLIRTLATSPVVASASRPSRPGSWPGSAARPTSCSDESGRDCRGMPRGSGS
jgi:nucleoside-diphosphate-sugar epimerase